MAIVDAEDWCAIGNSKEWCLLRCDKCPYFEGGKMTQNDKLRILKQDY